MSSFQLEKPETLGLAPNATPEEVELAMITTADMFLKIIQNEWDYLCPTDSIHEDDEQDPYEILKNEYGVISSEDGDITRYDIMRSKLFSRLRGEYKDLLDKQRSYSGPGYVYDCFNVNVDYLWVQKEIDVDRDLVKTLDHLLDQAGGFAFRGDRYLTRSALETASVLYTMYTGDDELQEDVGKVLSDHLNTLYGNCLKSAIIHLENSLSLYHELGNVPAAKACLGLIDDILQESIDWNLNEVSTWYKENNFSGEPLAAKVDAIRQELLNE